MPGKTAPTTLKVRLLGGLTVEDGDRELAAEDFGGVKPRQLFEILLTAKGQPLSKARIADLLWTEAMPENPAGAIDTYVSILRRRLSPSLERARDCPYLLGSRSGYRLDTSLLDLDVDRVDSLVTEGRRQRDGGDLAATLAAYKEAITLSRGRYLADEPDVAWALEPRRRFASMRSELLNAAADAALSAGDYALALNLGDDGLASNRADETAARLAMLAAYALGRQDHALHVYELTSAALRRDLGVRPSSPTEQLQAQILRGEPLAKMLTAASAARPTATIDKGEIPFLGREAELARLQHAADSAQRGVLLIVVEGEPGIGKSRLLEEFLRRSSIRSAAVKCSQLDRDLPFAALAGLLAALIEDLDQADVGHLLDAAPALIEVVPGLPVQKPPSSMPPEAGRIRLLDSVAAGLRILVPIHLLVDDLHWCDDSTVQALGRVLQRAPDASILLLASIRLAEAENNLSVKRLLDIASGANRLHSIRLDPLPRSAFDQLASLGVDADEMWAATGGHPLFLAERLRAGRGERLEESILIRVRAGSPKARRLLNAASVFEGRFSAGQLASVAGEADDALPDTVEELLAARLLVEEGEELRFPHDLMRRCVYEQLSVARRQLLHRKAFRALTGEGAPPAELAHHAEAGRLFREAIDNLNAAGERAVRQFANAEGAAHFGRAVAILDERPGLAKADQLERSLIEQARALTVLGRTDEAAQALERARTLAGERGNAGLELEATHWLARAHWSAWTPSRALPHALHALELAERIGEPRLIGREHALVANPYGSLGQLEQSWKHVGEALRIFRDLGDDPPAEVLYRAGFMRHLQGDDVRALRELEHAEAVAERQHAETEIVFVRWVRAVALANLGRYTEAFLALASAQAATKGEEAVARSRIPNTYGSLYADLELWDEALDRDYESLEVTGTIGGAAVKEPRIQSLLNLAEDHLALGALDRAAREVAEVERMMPGAEYGRFRYENRYHYVRSLLAFAREEWEPAVQFADQCLAHAASYGASKYEVRGRLARGQALWRLDRRQEGEQEIVIAAERAESLGFPTWARRSWGAAAALAGSATYRAKADAAVAQIAGHLEMDLRDRFLAEVSRERSRTGMAR